MLDLMFRTLDGFFVMARESFTLWRFCYSFLPEKDTITDINIKGYRISDIGEELIAIHSLSC